MNVATAPKVDRASREVQKARAEYITLLGELREMPNLPAVLQRELVSFEEEWKFPNRNALIVFLDELRAAGEVSVAVGEIILYRCDAIRKEKQTPNPEQT